MSRKLCIVQLADHAYYSERENCVRSVASYCKKMGYEWKGLTGSLNKNTHIAFQKPLALLQQIEDFEYVGWMDMDIVVANREFDVYNYLKCTNQDIVACRDPSFFDGDMINSGVLFFKNTDFAKNILKKWWGLRVEGTDKHWRHQVGNGDADQQFINKLLKQNDIVSCDPHHLNVHPKNYKMGDFAIHFMGYRPVDYEAFAKYANHIKDQVLLSKYWMVYCFQCYSLVDRFYENGRDQLMRDREYSPEDIFECAQKLLNIDVPH